MQRLSTIRSFDLLLSHSLNGLFPNLDFPMTFRFLAILLAIVSWAAIPSEGFGQSKPKSTGKKPAAPAKAPPVKLPPVVITPNTEPVMKVASIDRTSRDSVLEAAAKIDEMLERAWEKNGVKSQPSLRDDQFLRRIYLELGGRIPTYDEASKFLTSRSKDKRVDLIDTLLESPDYVSHFYNYWADVLRLCERPQNNIVLDPYLAYVKEKIAENKPYDKWVHEMLTADGKIWQNPAVGFQMRDDGMPLPYVDNTVRVFLGKQIGCAQCHDHPFDSWTQRQFYELAAFTAGTRTRLNGSDPEFKKGNPVNQLIKEAREKTPDGKASAALQQLVRANQFAVRYNKRELKLPHDYAYSDAKPNDIVKPKVLWGSVPTSVAKADRREQFAAWVISREDRQFARNIANRMWQKMFGLGIVEPVDDFRADNKPSNPELLEHLTDEVLRLNFDLRELVRIIANTKTYQKLAMVHEPSSSEVYQFASPILHRMTAEQLWDSLLTLVAYNPWAYQRPTAKEISAVVDLDLSKAKLADAEKVAANYESTYFLPKYNRDLQKLCGYKGQLLVRASEIPTPVPLGHFLRQFGQSDRETIEGGRTVGTVPQILAMFNGPITHILLEPGSVIYDDVMKPNNINGVDIVFISVLSHKPSLLDREFAVNEVKTAETMGQGFGNLIWSLLNTREFIFIQ